MTRTKIIHCAIEPHWYKQLNFSFHVRYALCNFVFSISQIFWFPIIFDQFTEAPLSIIMAATDSAMESFLPFKILILLPWSPVKGRLWKRLQVRMCACACFVYAIERAEAKKYKKNVAQASIPAYYHMPAWQRKAML
jgi:hypothetical protein